MPAFHGCPVHLVKIHVYVSESIIQIVLSLVSVDSVAFTLNLQDSEGVRQAVFAILTKYVFLSCNLSDFTNKL